METFLRIHVYKACISCVVEEYYKVIKVPLYFTLNEKEEFNLIFRREFKFHSSSSSFYLFPI